MCQKILVDGQHQKGFFKNQNYGRISGYPSFFIIFPFHSFLSPTLSVISFNSSLISCSFLAFCLIRIVPLSEFLAKPFLFDHSFFSMPSTVKVHFL